MISYYEDLMQWLSDYCKRHHIHVFYKSELDPNQKSYSYRYPRVIFLNDHWQVANEKPFILAHEIGHAMCAKEDLVTSKDTYSNISKNECKANIFAVKLLRKYCEESDIEFDSIYDFADAFGIPRKYQYLLNEVCY